MILFAGAVENTTNLVNDVWVLSDADGTGPMPVWSQLSPIGPAPAARFIYSSAYDSTSNRLVIYGGGLTYNGTPANDVWLLEHANGIGGLPQWTQLLSDGAPGSPRLGGCATSLNPFTNEYTIFGGGPGGPYETNDVWTLSNATDVVGTHTWTKQFPSGGPPAARIPYTGVYDPTTKRMTVFSGMWRDTNGTGWYHTDTWVLSLDFGGDTTPPVTTVTGVANGAVYTLGAVPTAGCTTTDSGSGVAVNATLSTSGGTSNGVGTFTATCSGAADNAGNLAAPVSVSYSVQYRFFGFFAPVSTGVLNSAKAGQTIPMKWQIADSNSNQVTSLGSVSRLNSVSIQCSGSALGTEVPADTSGSSGLRYDSTGNQFVFTWQTNRAWAGTCQRFVLFLDDGTMHSADFNMK